MSVGGNVMMRKRFCFCSAVVDDNGLIVRTLLLRLIA